jgi:Rieske Fe-S protein
MERRNFLKSSCNICLLAATGYFLSELTACSPAAYQVIKTEIINDEIQIPVASFMQSTMQFVRPKGWYYDIAVRKKEDNTYQALLMQCTHQENQLTPTGNGYTCSLHGSQFNKEGKVTKGPAENSLKGYTTSLNQENLIIHIKSKI